MEDSSDWGYGRETGQRLTVPRGKAIHHEGARSKPLNLETSCTFVSFVVYGFVWRIVTFTLDPNDPPLDRTFPQPTSY
jgi:hypothetical protein